MAKFTFLSVTGQLFYVDAPDGTTLAQAQYIADQQFEAGALAGLRPGDSISAPGYDLVKFALSRLDRGTAGQDNVPLVALNNGATITALPRLNNVSVENPITASDYVAQTPVTDSIGPLTPAQVQGLLAAAARAADQAADVMTEQGIGKYKLTAPQLEELGYLKPGTSCRYLDLCNDDAYQPPVKGN
jgi:hypothetical protein